MYFYGDDINHFIDNNDNSIYRIIDVVKYVARNSVYFRHMSSVLGRNVLVGSL